MLARRLIAALALATASLPALASAEDPADKTTARELARDGETALLKKDYTTAADRFGRAEALFPAPSLLVNLARAHAGLGKLVEAAEEYRRVTLDNANGNATYAKAIEDAKRELKALEPRLPWVVVAVAGPGADSAKLTLDGAELPRAAVGVKRAIDPGHHTLAGAAPNGPTAETQFDVVEGAVASASITVEAGVAAPPVLAPTSAPTNAPPTAPASSSDDSAELRGKIFRIAGWSLVGLGVVGVAVGGVGGGLALGKNSTLSNDCDSSSRCPRSDTDTISSYHTFATLSTVGFVAGGIAAAGGITLLVLAPSPKEGAKPSAIERLRLAPRLAFGHLSMSGSF